MTTEDDEKPGPKKNPPRKKKVGRKSPPSKQPGDDEYKRKIQKALEANLIEYAQKKRLSQKQITVINSFIEEHLSCFVLLGYTCAGEPVTLVNAPTVKDSDSLGTALQKFLMKYVDPPQQPPLY
tara:strand:- start:1 stop:372 length:372 start_codon:yes stop_codon:yes gene_type:complete